MKYILFTLLVFSYVLTSHAQISGLLASVDQNPVVENESFTLQVTATGKVSSDDIDFSVLNDNFRVSAPSVSQSTQIINGNRSSSISWSVTLFPKKTGKFTIPAFTIGAHKSKAIEIEVVPASSNPTQARQYYLTTAVSNTELYLQQQITYTVKLFLAGDIQSGSLGEPQLEGAIIEKVGDDKEYQELINGISYRVIERNFAIIPQSSGEYEIESPLFEARVLSGSRQSFAYFNRTKTINRVGPPQTIKVKPIPENYPYPWLPSEMVQIVDEWQGNGDDLVVGEPITHTITLTALGLIEEQLPDINASYHPSFKTYPETAQKATVERNNKLIAQTVQNIAVIPEAAGDFVLPEIRIPWFNVNTGETEFAVLPAKSIAVKVNANANADKPSTQLQEGVNDNTKADLTESTSEKIATQNEHQYLWWIFDWLHISLMAALFILMLLLIVQQRRLPAKEAPQKGATGYTVNSDEAQCWQNVEHALQQKQIGKLPQLIRNWLRASTQQTYSSATEGLAANSTETKQAFDAILLDKYANQTSALDLDAFKQKLTALRNKLNSQNKNQQSFYPN
ncbi:BatD family protein [Agaribacter flavus]|uniref:BatD family protein n=1 Tax=Agaribacter flavus TaxID=1902781 RepID=A0ABV7FSQ1_9ALTE